MASQSLPKLLAKQAIKTQTKRTVNKLAKDSLSTDGKSNTKTRVIGALAAIIISELLRKVK